MHFIANISLLSGLFLALTGVMAVIVLGLFSLYLKGRGRILAALVFVAWLLYVGVLGYRGILAGHTPPGPVFVVAPVVVFLAAFLARHPGVRAFAFRIPIPVLIGLQVFRVFVEIALYELYLNRLVPRLMTFEGGNWDILVGLSAPVIAFLYAHRRINDTAVRVWSIIGIVLLMNIVARALLTFAGVLKTGIPNVAIGMFPFTFLAGFLAPLALYLHVLVLRSVPRSAREKGNEAA